MFNSRVFILFIIVLLAAAARLLPHPPNFTPIAAMALFGGAYFSDKRMALILPLAAMALSDMLLGFHDLLLLVYLCFFATVYMGFRLQARVSLFPVLGGAVVSSILFFVITNFGVWLGGSMYPITFEGLVMAYTAAVPFFHNTLAGTLFYCLVLFGGFELLQKRYPELSYERVKS